MEERFIERIVERRDGVESLLAVKDPELKLQKDANDYLKRIITSFITVLKLNKVKNISDVENVTRRMLEFDDIDFFTDAELDGLKAYECYLNSYQSESTIELQDDCDLHFNLTNIHKCFGGELTYDVVAYISGILEYFIFQILVDAEPHRFANWINIEDIMEVINNDDEISALIDHIEALKWENVV